MRRYRWTRFMLHNSVTAFRGALWEVTGEATLWRLLPRLQQQRCIRAEATLPRQGAAAVLFAADSYVVSLWGSLGLWFSGQRGDLLKVNPSGCDGNHHNGFLSFFFLPWLLGDSFSQRASVEHRVAVRAARGKVRLGRTTSAVDEIKPAHSGLVGSCDLLALFLPSDSGVPKPFACFTTRCKSEATQQALIKKLQRVHEAFRVNALNKPAVCSELFARPLWDKSGNPTADESLWFISTY